MCIGHNSGEISKNYISAPTHQELIDWFRENHKIRIVDAINKNSMSSTHEKLYKFNIIKIDGLYTKDLQFGRSNENKVYNSYYEALNEAFKLSFSYV